MQLYSIYHKMRKRPIIYTFFKPIVLALVYVLLFKYSANAQMNNTRNYLSEVAPSDSSVYTLQYKKTDSTALDLTIFPSEKNQSHTPAIMFFFGGGWIRGSTDQFKPLAEYFAQRGLTGILVDYRVSSRHGTTPFDAVEDARDAVKFVNDHADGLGIDPKRIVLAGSSAGGHLALISSFLPKDGIQNPVALVLFYPVIDTGPEGYGYGRLGENYKTISPIDNIPENPPHTIVLLGTKDHLIDVEQAEDFCSEVKRNQGQCVLRLFEDYKHGFLKYRHTEYFMQAVREADRFLSKQQLLEGAPNVKEWMQNRDSIAN